MDSVVGKVPTGKENCFSGLERRFGFVSFKKSAVTVLFLLYKYIVSPALHTLGGAGFGCRFYPSCSCYAREAVELHGFLRGSFLSIKRILRCHPWQKNAGADFVPGSQQEGFGLS